MLDDVVNTMLGLHNATKRIEARYNSHISAHNGYQASLDRTGRRGRPAFIITAEQLTFLLEHSATEDRILRHIGSVHRGYYMAARGYEFYLRVFNSISHE